MLAPESSSGDDQLRRLRFRQRDSGTATSGFASMGLTNAGERIRRRLFREHFLQTAEHLDHRVNRQGAEALHQPLTIHCSQLIEHDIARAPLKSTSDPPGIPRPAVVIGATMTVRRWVLSSSGDTMTHGRVC